MADSSITKMVDWFSSNRWTVFILTMREIWELALEVYEWVRKTNIPTIPNNPVPMPVGEIVSNFISLAIMLFVCTILYVLLGKLKEYSTEIDSYKKTNEKIRLKVEFLSILAQIRKDNVEDIWVEIRTIYMNTASVDSRLSASQSEPIRKKFIENEKHQLLERLTKKWGSDRKARKYVEQFYDRQ